MLCVQKHTFACQKGSRVWITHARDVRAHAAALERVRETSSGCSGGGGGSSRRAILGFLGLTATALGEEASASEFGSSIAKIWRDRQKANSAVYIAPIKVALQRLHEATDLLINNTSADAYQTSLQVVRGSSLNCYSFDPSASDGLETRVSLVTQQYKFGNADTCTFRLIVKNLTGLLPDEKRREGEQLVESIIMSYQKLDGQLEEAINGSEEVRKEARLQLANTLSLMQQLEAYVDDVLKS